MDVLTRLERTAAKYHEDAGRLTDSRAALFAAVREAHAPPHSLSLRTLARLTGLSYARVFQVTKEER